VTSTPAARELDAVTGDIPALTSLRMFAAWLVFVHHFPPATNVLWGAITRQGHTGVTVFFVLSGFLITVRYYAAWTEGRLRLRDYFTKRIARILPLYYVVLVLSLLLSGEGFRFSGRRLPEWTMTQGFFWESLYHAAIPTSWSLTVEECFYALAPVVFAIVFAAGGLRRAWVWLGILTAVTVFLWVSGQWLVQLSDRHGLAHWHGFFANHRHMAIYTIGGRFLDFAVGIGCGLFYLRGGASGLWNRRGGTLFADALAILAALALVCALVLMDVTGGIEGAGFIRGWKYNLGVVLASGGIILSLTCPTALAARLLAWAPFVYMGKISYALYLIQMTPLGQEALLGVRLGPQLVHVMALYIAMNVVSALLFEGIEVPARKLVLRAVDGALAGRGTWLPRLRVRLDRLPLSWNPPPIAAALVAASVVVVLLGVVGASVAALAMHQGGPPVLSEALAAGGTAAPLAGGEAPEGREGWRRLRLPDGWSRGARAEPAFLLFVGEAPVELALGEPPNPTSGLQAFSSGPRSNSIFVRCRGDRRCGEVYGIRRDGLALRIGLRRAWRSPAFRHVLTGLGVLWIGLAIRASLRRPALHPWLHALCGAVALVAAATVSDVVVRAVVAATLGTVWLLAAAWKRT
jgi:peptidoglycan/LPS O-acetylase OafA/YrhL